MARVRLIALFLSAVNSTHKEAKEHYATNNLLSDTLRYLEKELTLLNSVAESYTAASGSAQGRTDFLQQLDSIVLNVRSNQNKVREEVPGLEEVWEGCLRLPGGQYTPRFVGRSWNAQKKRQIPFDSWWCADSKNVFFYQNRSMTFFKNCAFVFDTISFSLAAWLSSLLSRRPAFSSPTE